MKPQLVETKGNFALSCHLTKQIIPEDRPAVVERDSYLFTSRAALGQITIIATDLRDGATDEEFQKFWKEAQSHKDPAQRRQFAIDSFLAKFGPQGVDGPDEAEAKKKAEADTKKTTQAGTAGAQQAQAGGTTATDTAGAQPAAAGAQTSGDTTKK